MYELVYVNDITLIGSDSNTLLQFISMLNAKFSLKDFGALHIFLGIEVCEFEDGLLRNLNTLKVF